MATTTGFRLAPGLPARPRLAAFRKLPLRLQLEALEDRCLMSVTSVVRSIDGTGNNLAHPDWGSTGEDLLRTAPAAYADGLSAPAGADRPSARLISNTVSTETAAETDVRNNRNLSDWIYGWGQFVDHDIDLTGTGSTPFNIAIPQGDPFFDPAGTGTQTMSLSRSNFDPATGTTNARQQTNDITAYLDGSVIYGSDATRAAALRTFEGGHLKTSAGNLLPLNSAGLPNANDAHLVPDNQLFLAGDVRANENVELSSIQTLFVREHNRVADLLHQTNPSWTDEQIYQRAKQIVTAELQVITYNEFLPALLGVSALRPYSGYKPNVNPGIANEFSTAAFRIGHTLINDDVEFLDNNGNPVRDEIPLADAFFNPATINQVGVDPILKYLATDNAQEVDTKLVDGLRNFLFGPPGAGGFDLASRNIQRGRDHGLADYNTTRAAYGLPKATSFAQITSNVDLQQKLQQLYGSVDNIDLWVGGLAEDHVAGASVGPTFRAIIANQFERIRDGDRFWYQRTFSGVELAAIQATKLSDIIKRNTTISNIQDNVFFFQEDSISGHVFIDVNRNGSSDTFEPGVGGVLIKLFDASGHFVAQTRTRADGSYSFTGLAEGTYQVREQTPDRFRAVTPTARTVTLGEEGASARFDANFGVFPTFRFASSGPVMWSFAP